MFAAKAHMQLQSWHKMLNWIEERVHNPVDNNKLIYETRDGKAWLSFIMTEMQVIVISKPNLFNLLPELASVTITGCPPGLRPLLGLRRLRRHCWTIDYPDPLPVMALPRDWDNILHFMVMVHKHRRQKYSDITSKGQSGKNARNVKQFYLLLPTIQKVYTWRS